MSVLWLVCAAVGDNMSMIVLVDCGIWCMILPILSRERGEPDSDDGERLAGKGLMLPTFY
jgi:hypothetical protein